MDTNGSEIRFEGCGDVIRQCRIEAGLTLRELAPLVGCSFGALGKIEKNSLSVSLTLIDGVARALNISPESIVLKCMEKRFPEIRETKAGAIVAQYLSTGGEKP